MAGRNSEVEYLAKANSLLLLFLQQIFRASTTSPVFKVIKMKVEQRKKLLQIKDKKCMSSRVYKWKGDADAAGIFKCDASAPVCEREADAEGENVTQMQET
ncbi:hypothetical protein GLOIN_2v1484443 [Rhizophagus irregularis DAOM 181602=DAOM 197198]|uniref:Uncharacterized protein n=1 Tax=Rhizophagus irregularis (strain DAOM 181602 / DAOM 197198 / MUCL 43194) TaxID=747089 RepID=A0A2P4PEC5_RHIID|nr:hypothetical protein GLOIN_2v1484443 [Rhizophagus irregularis DAOM 181602=DAOM 197198]POG63738.1 hypothetical protein GLOIN_2v1484443 [Rhizophagus irregularis DAOM 181602=DAOM 197198]|eukprot:XP_025170604.1 hypothetical protein GLOIN_2v1484443 [Rhizophagus irregularis DAOM 181602=DAOM 197198]